MTSYWECGQFSLRQTKASYTLSNSNRELVHASDSDDRSTICRYNIQRVIVDGELVEH
jgi:hypothetical protein